MNQNYNGYNSYNNYESYEQYDGYDEESSNNSGGSGIFGTLFAIVALIGLVYILLQLLGIDVNSYIRKYWQYFKKAEVKEVVQEESKQNVKMVLKGYCGKLDSEGDYLLDEMTEDDVLEGKMNYCEGKVCYFSKGDDKIIEYDTEIFYTYACETNIYSEIPMESSLSEIRLAYGCKMFTEVGSYEKEFKDKTKISCRENSCVLEGKGKAENKICMRDTES